MRAHGREKTHSTERFALADIANVNLNHRTLAVFYCIAQRYTGVRVSAGIEYNATDLVGTLLDPINQVSLVVGLPIDKMHIRPALLNRQQNLCHRYISVNLRFTFSQTIQVRTIENSNCYQLDKTIDF